MPWRPLARIAFAVAIYPFQPSSPQDLPLEIGDSIYIIEQGGSDGSWFRGYLVAPPSLLAGLTSVKGQTLEARVFSGIFPRNCVQIREILGETRSFGQEGYLTEDNFSNGYTNGGLPSDDTFTRLSGAKRMSLRSRPSTRRKSVSTIEAAAISRSHSKRKSDKRESTTFMNKSSPRSIRSRQSFNQLAIPLSPLSAGPRDPSAPKPPAPVPMLKIGDETPTSAQEPLVDEIASCLREWHSTNLHELLLARRYGALEKMSNLVQQLDMARKKLLCGVLTGRELEILREKTVWDLVSGNKMLSGEVIVRDPTQRGRILTGDDSAIEITRLQAMMNLLDEKPAHHVEGTPTLHTLHHLLVDLKAFGGAPRESTTLTLALYSRTTGLPPVQISENYSADIPAHGNPPGLAQANNLKALFTDLSTKDIGEGTGTESSLYFVVKIQRPRAVRPVTASPSRNVVSREGSPQSSSHSPTVASPKGGRRSFMWGSKSSRDSHRNRDAVHTPTQDPTSAQGDTRPATSGLKPGSKDAPMIKRTVGVGVISIGHMMKADQCAEQVLDMWAPTTAVAEEIGDNWDEVIQDFIESRSGCYSKLTADRVHLHIQAMSCPDADTLIKKTPTLLHNIDRIKKIGFSGAPTQPRSDIYITISEALLSRNALLSHPKFGSLSIPPTAGLSNLQLTLEVRKSSGDRIENCIYPSSNSIGHTAWQTTGVEAGEGWRQTVRLAIPPDDVPDCHLVMSLADAPNFPFALCWMPLWEQQAFIRDGTHSLLLYKYDEHTSGTVNGKGAYLSTRWNAKGKDDISKDEAVTGHVATIKLESYLCSTRFSQDKVVLGLLKWRERTSEEVVELLKRVVFVPEIEIVKLLGDVFDSLFGILVEHSGKDDYEDLVFNALVIVLGIVHDRRFNVGPLVDRYAEEKFNYPFATPCLLRSYARLLSKPAELDSSRKLRAAFKVGRHILKLILNAREQQKIKEAGIGITSTQPTFTRDLRRIFKALENLMKSSTPILIGSQTLVVQHFHTWLPELSGLLPTEEVVQTAVDFMDACENVTGKLILFKLILIANYSTLAVFSQPENRRILAVNTVRWLAPYWGYTEHVTDQWRDQVRLCCSVVSSQVDQLGPEVSEYIPKAVESYLAIKTTERAEKTSLSLLFSRTYPFPTKTIAGRPVFDEALVEISALLAAMSCGPSFCALGLEGEQLSDLLFNTLQVKMSILVGEAFPSSWLSVHIYHHRSILRTLEYLSNVLVDSFLPHPDEADEFNTDLWRMFFDTLLKLVGSEVLTLETFPEQKRRAVWKIAGDIRESGADLLRRSWEAIGWETTMEDRRRYGLEKMGGYQVQYVPGLVAPIVELCLSVHEGLRSVAIEVLQTMIVSEWTLSDDLSLIQAEMIDCLNILFKSKPLTESILQKLFISELLDLFEPLSQVPDDPLYSAIKDLIGVIDELLDLLVAVHSPETTGEAFHIMHTLRLMEFLKDMQKEDIYIQYVHQLANLQAETGNAKEAGLALRLHADLYNWDPNKTVSSLEDPLFPEQTAFERKEQLYFEMIKHFEDGKSWDNALETYKELALQYETNTFDFSKLARTQRAMAKVYETISDGEPQSPRYFRVIYRGLGFPVALRDKQFIFEGSPSERFASFTDRMQQQHPAAQIVPAGEIEDVEGQFLQISTVSPHKDVAHPVYQRWKVSPRVREWALSQKLDRFSVTSRRRAGGRSITDHSVEKTVYITAETFPTILRRSEIVAIEDVRLSPLQTAIERTVRKTQELAILERRITNGDDSGFSMMTEMLNVSVDGTSAASIARYRDMLPVREVDEEEDEEAVVEEKEWDPLEKALQVALLDHALQVKRCLTLYSRSAHQATQIELTSNFEHTFAPELSSLVPSSQQRETPTPQASLAAISPPPTVNVEGLSNKRLRGETITSQDTSSSQRQTRHDKSRLSLSFLKRHTNNAENHSQHDRSQSRKSNTTTNSKSNGHGHRYGHGHHGHGFSLRPSTPELQRTESHTTNGDTTTDPSSPATTSQSRSRSRHYQGQGETSSQTTLSPPPTATGTATALRPRPSNLSRRSGGRSGRSGSRTPSVRTDHDGHDGRPMTAESNTTSLLSAKSNGRQIVGNVRKRFSRLGLGGGGSPHGGGGLVGARERGIEEELGGVS
ncbi:MAG: hypothetical protein M1819_002083 [Sarea resinae]|nr:MAG: hypothetical protein M1819_002083 [Sarea resinae]